MGNRKRRKLLDITYSIAKYPLADADYVLRDADGRLISHVATEGFVIGYWVDSFANQIVVIEIEREE